MKFLIPLISVALVLGTAGYVFLNPGRGPVEQVDPNEKGYVEEIDGTTVLHVKGTPYEMGYQHGALLRERTKAATDGFEKLLALGNRETGIPIFVFEVALDAVYRICEKQIQDRYKREMEGLADGAGVSLKTIRRAHIISEVTERGCSAFAVFGKATKDGKLYHGRSFDWVTDAGIQDNAVLIVAEPDGYAKFASAGYIGLISVLSGMNMEGVSISQIGAISKDKRFGGEPLMFLLRRILEEAKTVEDATNIITNSRRAVGYNYVVADGDVPDVRAYETTANLCAVFGPNDPKETVEYALPIADAVFRADEAMDPDVRKMQTCANGYPNMPYGSNSYDHRYKGMATRIKENYGQIDAEKALEILRAVAMRKVNLHCVLTNSTDREMWVAHAKGMEDAWTQPFVHYDLKQLFLPPAERAK